MKPCPFCGGEAELLKIVQRQGYGEYESHEDYHVVECKKCKARSTKFHQMWLARFSSHTVQDFRNNPALRARVEDEYAAYVEQTKQLAVEAWESRK